MMQQRQIILDTETTGLEPQMGHRVIEIGCIELINRRFTHNNFHHYINPEREVEVGALKVHGITNAFLQNKPTFEAIYRDFVEYVEGAQLIIHNAPFDVGFLNHEFKLLNRKNKNIDTFCTVLDTLTMAREKHPGQRNSLDALCKRYSVNNSNRKLHGALLDAELLAKVYLAMTGGQNALFSEHKSVKSTHKGEEIDAQAFKVSTSWDLPIIEATNEDQKHHEAYIESISSAE